MIKHPFTVREAMNSHLLKFVGKTAAAFKVGDSYDQPFILEEAGTWTVQSDWTDRTGYYVTYRIAPLDCRRERVIAAAVDAEKKWNELFLDAKERRREVVDHLDPATRITLYVHTDTYSIGD